MRIAFIYLGHPISKECAKAIGPADWYKFKTKYHYKFPFAIPVQAFFKAISLPHYDIYLIEGAMALTVAVFKKILGDRGKIIVRGCDPFFSLKYKPRWKQAHTKFLMSRIDGVIAVSEMVKQDIQKRYKI